MAGGSFLGIIQAIVAVMLLASWALAVVVLGGLLFGLLIGRKII